MHPLGFDASARLLLASLLDLISWDGAAMLSATQILLMLEVPIRDGCHQDVPAVVHLGPRVMDELNTLR